MTDTWTDSVNEAREITGYTTPVPEHTVAAVAASLPPGQRESFHAELNEVSDGDEFTSFLDDWWVTAVEHTSDDAAAAEKFALLAASLDRDKNPGKAYTYDEETDTWTEYRPGVTA